MVFVTGFGFSWAGGEPAGRSAGWLASSDLSRGSAVVDGVVRSPLLGCPASAGLRASPPARGMAPWCVGISLAEYLDPPETGTGRVWGAEQN